VFWFVSALHGVTLPEQTDEVDSQMHPRWPWQEFCEVSAVHTVSVPLHVVPVDDQLQPGVVHVPWFKVEHAAIVPVQLVALYEQPWVVHVELVRLAHGVTVPVHVLAPIVQLQPLVMHAVCDALWVSHVPGVPEHVPPAPAAVQVHPSPTHCAMLFALALVQVAHAYGVPEHVAGGCWSTHP
jgi:hypothetical protein